MAGQLDINPEHDFEALSNVLRAESRLQVPDFFTADAAEHLHRIHLENRDWYLAYNDGDNYFESPVQELQALAPPQKQRFMNNIYARARTQFQYVFFQYGISQAIELGEQPGHPMHEVHEFVNSEAFLAPMRTLTGDNTVSKADCFASNYAPGHFLTTHDDRHKKDDRVAAYLFGMTRTWDKSWGGHLAFFDDDGNVTSGFVPSFNTLNIFLVPQVHAVQLVSPFAGANRSNYLGWLQR